MELTKDSIKSYIDHTDVKADATSEDIIKLCKEAKDNSFHSVCVTPFRTKQAAQALKGEKVEVICVIGFPFGFTKTNEKILEAKTAIEDGATEIDMVINIGAVKEANWDTVKADISQIAQSISPIGLKVIMEIGFLTQEELAKACKIAEEAGAKFVKTSTGYGPRTPTVEDIIIMRSSVSNNIGIKASGGIHTFEQAKEMIEAGATRIGTSSALQIIGIEAEEEKDKAGSKE